MLDDDFSRKDLLLMLMAIVHDDEFTPAHLQKAAYLLLREFPEMVSKDYYQFEFVDYGVFCKDVFLDAELLKAEGYVAIGWNEDRTIKMYRAKRKGAEHSSRKFDLISVKTMDSIREKIEWLLSLDFNQLIRIFYKMYPETSLHSVFQMYNQGNNLGIEEQKTEN